MLVANFAGPLRITPYSKMLGKVQEFADEDFQAYLDEIVWPMVRFVRAVLPQMIERRSGKIVAFTSAVAVRAIPGLAVYSAARGAQNAFVLASSWLDRSFRWLEAGASEEAASRQRRSAFRRVDFSSQPDF
ncbi:short-chain dehydrogenase/reductase SDR [Stigmatella aurantiaca DW4/3-1]|uniref:3-oxoacyl-acyl carrier protein reductase n=1 Tax=Stigmatella aurantiaca (strain DW4/3-1) TaxID=378806 RepID=Q08QU8_STIAD|nr:short-chain dehydrogenase/reductase SDR [Stigmatella aurantiaca DW4/3-1]EAU62857.1 3-oxoacyl-acyl carrier protein reductase [Stigmatella aurantiaca DW4/3-1]